MFKFPKSNNGKSMKTGNIQTNVAKSSYDSKTSSTVHLSKESIQKPSAVVESIAKNVHKKKLSKFEELTNLSESRPEIVMLSDFMPLFTDEGEKTSQGNLFDLYIESMRRLDAATQAVISSANKKFIERKNEDLKQQVLTLKNRLGELNVILRMLAVSNKNLNVHNSNYQFSPIEFCLKTFEDSQKRTKLEDILPYAEKLPENLSLEIALADNLLIDSSEVKRYASTKLWLMCVRELRNLLISHSRKSLRSGRFNQTEASVKSLLPNNNDDVFRINMMMFELAAKIPAVLIVTPTSNESSNIAEQNLQTVANNILAAGGVGNINPAATIISNSQTVTNTGIQTVAAIENLNSTVQVAMKKMDEMFFSYIKDEATMIAVVFHLIAKELRLSTFFDQNNAFLRAFRSPGTTAFTAQDYIHKILGDINAGADVYKSFSTNINITSLSELAYSRNVEDVSKQILTLEESSSSNYSSQLIAGGEYFFDAEAIFSNVTSTGINVNRLFEISKEIENIDKNFFEIATNMGFFQTSDQNFENAKFDASQASNKEVPIYTSFNPSKFANNILKLLVNQNGTSRVYENNGSESATSVIKQRDRGISAIIAKAGEPTEFSRKIRAALFLSIMELVEESSSKGMMDSTLLSTLREGSTKYGDESYQQLINEMAEYAKKINDTLKEAAESNDNSGIQSLQKSTIENFNSSNVFVNLPCKYDDASDLGDALRKNKLVNSLASAMRDLKKTFISFACKNGSYSAVSNVHVNTVLALFFNAVCVMVAKFSDNKISNITSDMDFSGGYSYSDVPQDKIEDFLKSLGGSNYQLVTYVDYSPSDHTVIKADILSTIEDEMKSLTSMLLSVVNFLDSFNSSIQNVYDTVNKFNKNAVSYLLSYLGTTEKLASVMKEPQLMLLLSTVEDLYQNFNFVDENNPEQALLSKSTNSLHYSDVMVDTMQRFFNDGELADKKGYNKKILSVGLPQGLMKGLLKNPLLSNSNKHNDIIKISIYKMDVINNDIVYKPKEFLFELSRFPARMYSSIKAIPSNVTGVDDLANCIPTRNYSLYSGLDSIDTGAVSYWDDMSSTFGDEYSFLSTSEKNQIIENHITSFILENYLKVMTGMDVSDVTFNLSDEEAESLLDTQEKTLESIVQNAASISSDVLSSDISSNVTSQTSTTKTLKGINSMAGVAGTSTGFSKKNISISKSLGANLGKSAVGGTKSLSVSTLKKLPLSALALDVILPPADSYIKLLLQPKKFDRVFNIIFDPEFEVDYSKTTANRMSSQKLMRLVNDSKTIKSIRSRNDSDVRYVDVDKSSADPSMDSFFVVVETHAETYEGSKKSMSQIAEDIKSRVEKMSVNNNSRLNITPNNNYRK